MLRVLTICILALLLAIPSTAETIRLQRGLALDTWITWPGDDRYAEPGLVAGFPEWRGVVNDADLKAIKTTGFDFVRLGLDPAMFLWPANRDKRPTLIKGMHAAMDRLKAADLKIVVDLHALPVTPGWKSLGVEAYLGNERNYAAYLELVADIGKQLADENPARVAFEPMNEPTVDCDWGSNGKNSRWQAMAQRLHRTARAAAPKLTIILSGACWGGAWGLSHLDAKAFADDNTIWSFHSYEPFIFTHQGASWTGGPESHVEGLRYPPERKQYQPILAAARKRIASADVSKARKLQLDKELAFNLKQYMRDGRKEMKTAFATVKGWARRNKIPPERVVLGEFGAHRLRTPAEDDPSRANYLREVRMMADKAGYAWSVWGWSGTFGIAQNNDSRAFSPLLLDALGMK